MIIATETVSRITADAAIAKARRAARQAAVAAARSAREARLNPPPPCEVLTHEQARYWALKQEGGEKIPQHLFNGDHPNQQKNLTLICRNLKRPNPVHHTFVGWRMVLMGTPDYIEKCAIEDEGNRIVREAHIKAAQLKSLATKVEQLTKVEPGVHTDATRGKVSVLTRTLWLAAVPHILEAHATTIRELAKAIKANAQKAADEANERAQEIPKSETLIFAETKDWREGISCTIRPLKRRL